MDDQVVARHRFTEARKIVRICPHNLEAGVAPMVGVVPLLPRREIVIESQLRGPIIGEQRVGEVTADEAGPADDDHSLALKAHAGTRQIADVFRPNLWR